MVVGSGVDVIAIARVERTLARRGPRFLQRVFTPAEVAACRRHRRPGAFLAACFAAKEAAMKAVGTGWSRGVGWLDVETLAGAGASGGRPGIALHGRAGALARERGARAHLAVGRTRELALAVVVLEDPSR